MFAGVDQTFVAGLRGALAEAGLAHDLLLEPAGTCAVKDQVTEKIQRLLLQSPDVVTGVMGVGLSRHMHPFFSDAEIPMILNDLGPDPLMTGAQRNPWLFSNSLNLWQSMYALGFWAAAHLGRKACIAAAFHEGGYGMVPAFWLGFEQAGGGSLLATQITHRDSADEDPSAPLRMLAGLNPDFVMAFYSGREGIAFMNAWSALGLGGRFPLLTTPLMFHAQWLDRMGDTPAGARTAFAWDTGARPEAHDRFRRAAKIRVDREPAVFGLLGYETGLMIAEAVRRAPDAASGGRPMRDALSEVTVASPRGDLRFDEATGEVATVDHLQEMRRAPGGILAPVTIETLPLPPSFRENYARIANGEERSGWFNPYLVT